MTGRRPKTRGTGKKKRLSKKKVLLSGMASDFPLTEAEIKNIKLTYDLSSKSDRLEVKKVGTVLRLIGGAPTENELNEVVSTFGEEGTLSFTEFLGIVEKHRSNHGFMGDELREAFGVFDSNGDGEIDAGELISILTQVGDPLTETEAEELVRESDLNGDGKINYFEFVAMTMKP